MNKYKLSDLDREYSEVVIKVPFKIKFDGSHVDNANIATCIVLAATQMLKNNAPIGAEDAPRLTSLNPYEIARFFLRLTIATYIP